MSDKVVVVRARLAEDRRHIELFAAGHDEYGNWFRLDSERGWWPDSMCDPEMPFTPVLCVLDRTAVDRLIADLRACGLLEEL